MESNLADNILIVYRTLNKFSVKYMILGGSASTLPSYFPHSFNVSGEIA